MTPAIITAKNAGINYAVHEYQHDSGAPSYGLEAAEKLGVEPDKVFKTLVADAGNALVVAVVPVAYQLNLKSLAKAVGAKKSVMAPKGEVERVTGYVVGGVSPLGQKKRLRTVIDDSARDQETVFVSAGRRGLEIEIAASDLADLTRATFACLIR